MCEASNRQEPSSPEHWDALAEADSKCDSPHHQASIRQDESLMIWCHSAMFHRVKPCCRSDSMMTAAVPAPASVAAVPLAFDCLPFDQRQVQLLVAASAEAGCPSPVRPSLPAAASVTTRVGMAYASPSIGHIRY